MGDSRADSKTGLVDRTDRGYIEVTGNDAVEYLQGQVTNDIESLAPGEGCYAVLLNPKGRILSDARVLVAAPDRVLIDTEPAGLEAALKDLRMYKIGRAVEVADHSNERATIGLVGEDARSIVATAFEVEVPEREHSFIATSIDGRDVFAVSTALGCDLLVTEGTVDSIKRALIDGGATKFSAEVAEGKRIELGIPCYGLDMTEENLPGEAGIVERAVSFTKGCYVGQEPVARMFHKGHPNRILRGLRLSKPAPHGAALSREGKQVGSVGSTGASERYGDIALAIVRREVEAGEQLEVDADGVTATVVELPFR